MNNKLLNLLHRGKYQSALDELHSTNDPFDEDIETRCLEAFLYLRLGALTESELTLKSAAAIDADNAHVLSIRALLLLKLGRDVKLALEFAKKAYLKLNDEQSELILAESEMANGLAEQAVKRVESLCKKKASYADAFVLLANMLKAYGRLDEALVPAQKAVQINPSLSEMWAIIAEYYSRHSNLEKVITSLEMAHKYDPDNPAYPILLGEFIRVSGDTPRAVQILQKVVSNIPEDPRQAVAAYVNLGAALHEGGRSDDAVEMYQKALRLNANMPQIENNIAKSYLEKEDNEEAKSHLRKALQLDPDYYKAMNNLATVLAFEGDYENSFYYRHKSLEIITKRYPQDFLDPKKAPMPVSGGEETILAMHAALTELNVPFFLAFGTLLGLVRDGHLLPFDKDLDIGVSWDLPRGKLLNALGRYGFISNGGKEYSDDDPVWNYAVVYVKTGIALDFFFFKHEGDKYITGIDSKPVNLKWVFPYFELQQAHWQNRDWFVPSPPDVFFESVYGKDWKAPDPYFDTVISGMNRTKESDNIALNSGYIKLYDQITRCEWKKAIGICKQLRAIREDPFVEKMENWNLKRLRESQEEAHA